MQVVRDKLWLWCHEAGSHNAAWGLRNDSRITPTEAAYYMGIPNCIMVVYGNKPEPPFEQYALPLSTLDKVVWSIVGDASSTRNDEDSDLDQVLALSERYPNIVGGMMDDFFHRDQPRHSAVALAEFRRRLRGAVHPLDLWVVLYHRQLDLPVADCLAHCDTVSLWTMQDDELARLEPTFERFVALTPKQRRVMGVYMWNYGAKKPMTMTLLRRQCELGLEWLGEGRLDGIIFLASCICDLELEAVEWVRSWVNRVGDRPV